MASKKTVLITGCSAGGLGDSLARAFHQKGYRVIASARNPKKMAHLGEMGMETVIMDVLSQESIKAAVQEVSHLTGGKLDILLNNSGGGYFMPILDVDIAKAQELFNLNVFSYIAVTQAFFPLLRDSAPGSMVVNNTSVSSVAVLPGQGIYTGSKAAMASISQALRMELSPFDIQVVDLKTGAVRSGFFENQGKANSSDGAIKLPPNSVYDLGREPIEYGMNGQALMDGAADTDVWAKQVVSDLSKKNPSMNIWRGGSAWLIWFATTFLPAGALDRQAAVISGFKAFADKLQAQKKQS